MHLDSRRCVGIVKEDAPVLQDLWHVCTRPAARAVQIPANVPTIATAVRATKKARERDEHCGTASTERVVTDLAPRCGMPKITLPVSKRSRVLEGHPEAYLHCAAIVPPRQRMLAVSIGWHSFATSCMQRICLSLHWQQGHHANIVTTRGLFHFAAIVPPQRRRASCLSDLSVAGVQWAPNCGRSKTPNVRGHAGSLPQNCLIGLIGLARALILCYQNVALSWGFPRLGGFFAPRQWSPSPGSLCTGVVAEPGQLMHWSGCGARAAYALKWLPSPGSLYPEWPLCSASLLHTFVVVGCLSGLG